MCRYVRLSGESVELGLDSRVSHEEGVFEEAIFDVIDVDHPLLQASVTELGCSRLQDDCVIVVRRDVVHLNPQTPLRQFDQLLDDLTNRLLAGDRWGTVLQHQLSASR